MNERDVNASTGTYYGNRPKPRVPPLLHVTTIWASDSSGGFGWDVMKEVGGTRTKLNLQPADVFPIT